MAQDEENGYIAKDRTGAVRTGANGLLTAKEFYSTIVADEPFLLLKPKGGGAGGGSKTVQNNEGKEPTFKQGSYRHQAYLAKNNPADHDRLFGPGGQFYRN